VRSPAVATLRASPGASDAHEAEQESSSSLTFLARARAEAASLLHRSQALLLHRPPQDPADHPEPMKVTMPFRRILSGGIIWLAIMTTLAFLYKRHKKDPREKDAPLDPKESPKSELENGHFNCLANGASDEVCLMSFCCISIRWADTMDMSGILGYWLAFALFAGLAFLNMFSAGFFFALVLTCICVYFRQSFRAKFGVANCTPRIVAQDFFFYACCSCCAVSQEARVVDRAWQVGHDSVKDIAQKTMFDRDHGYSGDSRAARED